MLGLWLPQRRGGWARQNHPRGTRQDSRSMTSCYTSKCTSEVHLCRAPFPPGPHLLLCWLSRCLEEHVVEFFIKQMEHITELC
ncbi:Protein Virilizer [Manis pentadactyla]|nr:Protein Virilizer [Manis pentadactyla]